MHEKVTTFITRAKDNLDRRMSHKAVNHPDWPPHNILCDCRKCSRIEFNYIKEMRKENRLARQKARQKVGKK